MMELENQSPIADEVLSADKKRVELLAEVTHAANRAYARMYGQDKSIPKWEDTTEEQKSIQRALTALAMDDTSISASDVHGEWCAIKGYLGWEHGEKKDFDLKTHPDIVPFYKLPDYEAGKSELFVSIINAFR